MIKAAIFDLDGTILDSMPVWIHAGEIYLANMGKKPEENLGFKLLTMNMKEGADYLAKNYSLNFSEEEIISGINKVVQDAYKSYIQPKKNAVQFLTKLKSQGTKIALCTNTDRISFYPALIRLDLVKYFDFIFSTAEIGISKAHKECFFKVAGFLQSAPEETWVFEDALYSIKTAVSAGFKTCCIWDQYSEPDETEIKKICTVHCKDWDESISYFSI